MIEKRNFRRKSEIWPYERKHYFHNLKIKAIQQRGPTCVAHCLAMMTGTDPQYFIDLMQRELIDIQDPRTWSDALKPFAMKLAFVPSDIRKMKHYMNDLVAKDDMFALCYYSSTDPDDLLTEPDGDGWLTGSHIVLLHRDIIYDSKTGMAMGALDHECCEKHTKRIFRVVPLEEERGL